MTKDSEAHAIDVNGKDTRIILAVKSNILCYSLIDEKFLSSYEGHASNIVKLKYMEYTVDQKKEIDDVKKEFFMSIAEGENNSNIWKASTKEEGKIIASPFKMLELTDKKEVLSIQIKQIAGQYYFATIVTTHSVWGYIWNLKTKSKDLTVLKKWDFRVSIDKSLIKRNLFIVCAHIINETDIVILNGNAQTLNTYSFTYLNADGKSPGTDLKIEYEEKQENTNGDHKNIDTKVLGLEYDQIQTKYQKSSNSILNGIDINKIEDKLKAAFKDSSKKILKTGSLVAVLEQSLHANDIETINWAISTTDMHIINETVRKDTKVLGLEYDQIQTKYQKSSNSILNGIDINKIEDKLKAAFKDSSKKILKTGSLVAVLEQSLHANDIETINWAISTTDMHIINETVRKDTKVLGLEYDQIQTKYQKSSNSILNGIDINKIEDKLKAAFKDSSKKILKTGSLVAVLEQSLHANDIETINWAISTTDMHIINETVRKDTKVLGLE